MFIVSSQAELLGIPLVTCAQTSDREKQASSVPAVLRAEVWIWKTVGRCGEAELYSFPVIQKAVHLEWKEARTVYESCIHRKQQGKDRGDNEEEGVLPGENKESARTIGTISSGSTDHPDSLFSPNIHWL